jgi:hypothetical protein
MTDNKAGNPFKAAIRVVRPVAEVPMETKEQQLVLNSHQPAKLVFALKILAASSRRSQTDLITEALQDLIDKHRDEQ